MEPTHKVSNSDCYFFYYSTCKNGDNCKFRHEPSALGCEVMCNYWQQGNCLNERCNFRHMDLGKKNRKTIPCYWETQRGGCQKQHCPFLHTAPRPTANPADPSPIKAAEVTPKPAPQEWSNRQDDSKLDGSGTESDQGRGSSEGGSFIGSPAVDPLIVNFDEESDNESAPSPVKRRADKVPLCKTYEQMRLEEIQAESAAYYAYEPTDSLRRFPGRKHKRIIGIRAARRKNLVYVRDQSAFTAPPPPTTSTPDAEKPAEPPTFKVLTLDEIRLRKRAERIAKESSRAAAAQNTTAQQEGVESADLNVAHHTETPASISRKRSLDTAELYSNDEEKEVNRISKISRISNVPPVRLRRNLVSSTIGTSRSLTISTNLASDLCDSNVSVASITPEESSGSDEEYLTEIVPASEDLLKDIDAVLGKSTV